MRGNHYTQTHTALTVIEPWHQFVDNVLHGTVWSQVLGRLCLVDEHITRWAVSVGLDVFDYAGLADCSEKMHKQSGPTAVTLVLAPAEPVCLYVSTHCMSVHTVHLYN